MIPTNTSTAPRMIRIQILPLVDLEPLENSAAEFEERISKLVSKDPELRDYVKQLKRREFAQ